MSRLLWSYHWLTTNKSSLSSNIHQSRITPGVWFSSNVTVEISLRKDVSISPVRQRISVHDLILVHFHNL